MWCREGPATGRLGYIEAWRIELSFEGGCNRKAAWRGGEGDSGIPGPWSSQGKSRSARLPSESAGLKARGAGREVANFVEYPD